MQLGIFARTFPVVGAVAVCEAVRSTGYTTTQFNLACLGGPSMPEAIDPALCGQVRAAMQATGVSMAAVSGTYNMAHPDAAVRARGLARLEVLIAHARALGTGMVSLCTGSRDPDDQWRHHPDNATAAAWAVMRTEMAAALQLAERHGIDLGIEPELANVVSSARAARRLLDELPSPRLKVILDPANLFEIAGPDRGRRVIADAVDLLGPHIAMAHAKDRAADGRFVAAGTGIIDFARFVADLRGVGFDGPLVTHGLEAGEAAAVAAFLSRILSGTTDGGRDDVVAHPGA
jgi:sugar phosphate isomerase/epimerase